MRVNLVASCADKKLLPVPPELHLRKVLGTDTQARAAAWCQRLATADSRKVSALEMYGGQHWSVVRALPTDAEEAGLRVQLWVASAGYGLWDCSLPVHAYSATFSGHSPDAVVAAGKEGRTARQEWWEALGRGAHRSGTGPNSLAELHQKDSVLMVVAPSAYVEAMESDLARIVQGPGARKRLLVVSTSSSLQQGPLGPYWVECPGTLARTLGGGMASLHARLARHILGEARETQLEVPAVKERVAALVRKAGHWPENNRAPVSDDEVLRFIRSELHKQPGQSRTGLLRQFRDSGRKCQMERFNRLFADVTDGAPHHRKAT